MNMKVTGMEVLQHLAYAKKHEWFTIARLAKEMKIAHKTTKDLVFSLATEDVLQIQDGWTENEEIRFRLKPELLNNWYTSKKSG